jgi:hypothetical protein
MTIPMGVSKLKVGDQEVTIDPSLLEFNEATLGGWQDKAGVWYAYYSEQLANAEFLLAKAEEKYETKYYDAFKIHKAGNSDKLAEANARTDADVLEAQTAATAAKLRVTSLKGFLRAFDKAHDNAQSRNYMLRKEMDKLHGNKIPNSAVDPDIDAKLNEIMRGGKKADGMDSVD